MRRQIDFAPRPASVTKTHVFPLGRVLACREYN
jgi:hypothetical protein